MDPEPIKQIEPTNPLQLDCCPDCGYSLHGLPDRGMCPECGLEYGPDLIILYGKTSQGVSLRAITSGKTLPPSITLVPLVVLVALLVPIVLSYGLIALILLVLAVYGWLLWRLARIGDMPGPISCD